MTRKMKRSRIPFVEDIPLNWEETKLRTIGKFSSSGIDKTVSENEVPIGIINYVDVYNNKTLKLDKRDYMMVTTSPEKASKHVVNVGDLIFTPSSETVEDIGVSALVDEPLGNVAFSYHVLRFEFDKLMNHEFKKYLCNNYATYNYFSSCAVGTIRKTLSREVFKETRVTIPPMDEQQRIADFLDVKCAEIDSTIEKTQKTIEEYKALKQSIITKAVTKGIRGDRPMKDSGIEWVGDIPEEWNSINPKALFSQRKEKAARGERQLTASQQYGVIYQDEFMELTGNKVVTVEKDFDILKHVEAGDFVISMRSFQGGLEYSTNTGSISSAYVMLIPNLEMVFPSFYKWLLKSAVYINALQSTTNMVRDGQAMRYANFIQVRLYTVPMDEQKEIADWLDKKCNSIDTLISQKEEIVQELEEYKKSLIYEYVTGKKEVPEWQ